MEETKKNIQESSQTIVQLAETLRLKIESSSKVPFDDKHVLFVDKIERTILEVCAYLKSIDLDIYSHNDRNAMSTGLTEMARFYDNLSSTGKVNTSASVFNEFESMYNQFVQYINNIVPFNSISNVLMDELKIAQQNVELQAKNAEILFNEAHEYKEEIVKAKDEVLTLLENTRNASREVVIAKFGSIYHDLADKHKMASRLWLAAISSLIVITVGTAIYLLNDELEFVRMNTELLDHSSSVILLFGTRLVIFASLFIAIGICIRNFKAHKHNEVVNRHRQNALNTFETFVLSSGDDKTIKDAILMEVTRTIFSSQNSGFSSADVDAESPSKIIEIIKNVSGKD